MMDVKRAVGLFFLATTFLAGSASAVEFGSNDYEVYSGNLNNDGCEDIYLKAKERVILITVDITTPILIPPAGSSYKILSSVVDSQCTYPDANILVDESIDVASLTVGGYQYVSRDFNNDGISDARLLPAVSENASLIIAGGNSPSFLDTIVPPVPTFNSVVPPNMAWNGVEYADWYNIQHRVNGAAWVPTTLKDSQGYVGENITTTSGIHLSFEGLPTGQYQYRIRACNASFCSSYSAPTEELAVIRTPSRPSVHVEGNTTSATVYWLITGGGAGNYEVDLRYNSGDFSPISFDAQSRTAVLNNLAIGSYTVRVRTCVAGLGSQDCSSYDQESFRIDESGFVAALIEPDLSSKTPAAIPTVPQSDINSTDTIGTLPGEFNVDASGSATYSIPIEVPAGSGNTTPNLSLNYASQSGNGLLGIGWSLGGTSQITRVRQTLQQDGEAKKLSLNADDRFSLDGQRLIMISGHSSYGDPGSEYRTEIDSFVKVFAHGGTAGAGAPDYFEVQRPDGSITFYGGAGSHNSEHLVPGTNDVYSWKIESYKDSSDNLIAYGYVGQSDNTGHRLERIDYAFDSSNNRASHNAYVIFDYGSSNRADPYRMTINGSTSNYLRRLQEIRSYSKHSGQPYSEYRRYELKYLDENLSANQTSRLEKVSVCVGNQCLPATSFDWHQPVNTEFESTPDTVINFENSDGDDDITAQEFGDINGDGVLDFIWVFSSQDQHDGGYDRHEVRYLLGGVNQVMKGSSSDVLLNGAGNQRSKLAVVDVNGDGRSDVMWYRHNQWVCFLSEPQPNGTWALNRSLTNAPFNLPGEEDLVFADINSDGLVDAVYETNKNIYVRYLAKRSGESESSKLFYDFGSPNLLSSFVNDSGVDTVWVESFSDIDMDGRADVIVATETSEYQHQHIDLRAGESPINSLYGDGRPIRVRSREYFSVTPDGYKNSIGKYFNGFSSPHFLLYLNPSSISTDANIGSVNLYADMRYEPYLRQYADVNGDGEQDILEISSQYYECFNDGIINIFETCRDGAGLGSLTYLESYLITLTLSGSNDKIDLTPQLRPYAFSTIRNPVVLTRLRPRMVDVNDDGYLDFVFFNYGQFIDSEDNRPYSVSFSDRNGNSIPAGSLMVREYDPVTNDFKHTRQLLGGLDSQEASQTATYLAKRAFGDLNGDGIKDFVFSDALVNKSGFYLSKIKNVPTNKIHKITNGLGAAIDLTYESLANTDNYTRVDPSDSQISNSEFYSTLNAGLDLLGSVHTLGDDANNDGMKDPVLELHGAMYVVTEVRTSSPTNDPDAKRTHEYHYQDARLQAMGRGFLGFGRRTVRDVEADISTTSWQRQDFPFTGQPGRIEIRRTSDNLLLSSTDNVWQLKFWNGNASGELTDWIQDVSGLPDAGEGLYYPYLHQSTVETFNLSNEPSTNNGGLVTRQVTENILDGYGNTTETVVTTTEHNSGYSNSFSSTTTLTFNNRLAGDTFTDESVARWRGLPDHQTVTTSRNFSARAGATNTQPTETLVTAMGYNSNGLLATQVVADNLQAMSVTSTFTYDSYGQLDNTNITETGTGYDGDSRSTSEVYEGSGRYLKESKNALNHTVTVRDRDVHGRPVEITDANGIKTFTRYSAFGREYLDYRQDGSYTITTISQDNIATLCPANSSYYNKVQTAGGGESIVCYDILGRETRTASKHFNGQDWSKVDTIYDSLGRVHQVSEPYISNNPVYSVIQYDVLNRVTSVSEPGRGSTSTIYNGLKTTVTSAPTKNFSSGLTKTEWRNAIGEVVEVQDHIGGVINYDYDALGNMNYMESEGQTTRVFYDSLGRKTRLEDPDKGTWSYIYNGFNEITSQTDGKGQITETQYDDLGRIKTRVDRDHLNAVVGTANWDYDQGNKSIGRLSGRSQSGSGDYQQTYTYDNHGRLSVTGTSMDGNGRTYMENVYYDEYSRPLYITDAANDPDTDTNSLGFASRLGQQGVENHYNLHGYLEQISSTQRNADGSPYEVYQTIDEMDARGNIVKTQFGNDLWTTRTFEPNTGRLTEINTHTSSSSLGDRQDLTYHWDNVGNLDYREQIRPNSVTVRESFNYDGLNRLKDYRVNNGSPIVVEYDALGNIENKSDVGSADYVYTARSLDGNVRSDAVSQVSGPHAVTNVAGSDYRYDANGNNTSGGNRQTTYSVFDKPLTIIKGGHTTAFAYGPDRNRYRRVDTDSAGVVRTTYYVGSVEFTEDSSDSTTEVKRYIGDVAIVTLKVNNTSGLYGRDIHYRHYDHLGSLDLITDSNGAIVDQFSFDPWGKRRAAVDWTQMSEADLIAFTKRTTPVTSNSGLFDLRQRFTRGFTGHEMLDEVGIIHMNGRIYDPHLARFVQADPIVQAPFNTQSLNRYSYIWNNPLNGIDPSGFMGEKNSESESSPGGDSWFNFSFNINFSFGSGSARGFARVRPTPGINDASFGNVSSGLVGESTATRATNLPTLHGFQALNALHAAEGRGLELSTVGEISAFFEILQEERVAQGLSTNDVMLAEDLAAIGQASIQMISSAPGARETIRLASGVSRMALERLLRENYRKYLIKRLTERLKAADSRQLALNRANGAAFEREVIEALGHVGAVKNNKAVTVPLLSGKQVTTIPDLWGRSTGGILEIKNVLELSNSDQLRAQLALALRTNTPFNLVVSPRTQKISRPLKESIDDVIEKVGGGIYRYDPSTGDLSNFL
ncbi:hypothetical protein KFE80_06105 [bacterium SCSIO 12696]|nr:hypothetical protein KFE80_06105 [bacterium SCSIO 12696]